MLREVTARSSLSPWVSRWLTRSLHFSLTNPVCSSVSLQQAPFFSLSIFPWLPPVLKSQSDISLWLPSCLDVGSSPTRQSVETKAWNFQVVLRPETEWARQS